MSGDAIEPRTEEHPPGGNGKTDSITPQAAAPKAEPPARSDPIQISILTERIERLESEQRRLRRDSFLLAALTAIVSLFLASSLVKSSLAPSKEPDFVVARRFVEAQTFLLKDAQGHVRAKLTAE